MVPGFFLQLEGGFRVFCGLVDDISCLLSVSLELEKTYLNRCTMLILLGLVRDFLCISGGGGGRTALRQSGAALRSGLRQGDGSGRVRTAGTKMVSSSPLFIVRREWVIICKSDDGIFRPRILG